MYAQCMYNVCTMYAQCMPNVCPKHAQCIHIEASASHMWNTLRCLLPAKQRDSVGTFERIQKFVKVHQLMTAITIPVCPCGETIYYDFEDRVLRKMFPFSTASRKNCQLCGESKLVFDNGGRSRVRRQIYYFPYRFVPNSCPYCAQCMPNVECIYATLTMCARFWLTEG